MKEVRLNEEEFKAMLDGVKHTVATDDRRPILQYIRVEVKNEKITAYTLDGYRASRFTIDRKGEALDEFVCYIKPVPFKVSKGGTQQVVIAYDEDMTTTVQFNTELGEITYKFNTRGAEFPHIEEIFGNAEEHDYETGINAVLLMQAMKALAKTDASRNHVAVIEGKRNPVQPMLFKAKTDHYENTQLILPVRLFSGE